MGAAATSWLRKLLGYTVITQGGVPVPSQLTLELPSGTLADDPVNQRTVYTAPPQAGQSSSVPLLGSSLALGAQTPPQWQDQPYPSQSTVGTETISLAAIPLPAGKVTVLRVFAVGVIMTAASKFVALYSVSIPLVRIGTGAPAQGPTIIESGWPASAAPFAAVGSPGSFGGSVSGNSFVLQAIGFPAPTAWSAGAYAMGNIASKGGNTYIVASIAGTGTSVSGPSGTGAGIVDNAGANQVTWDWLAAGSSVPCLWGCKVDLFTP